MAAQSLASFGDFIYKAYGNQGATILAPKGLAGKISKVTYVTSNGELPTHLMTGHVPEGPNDTGPPIKYNLNKSANELGPGTIRIVLDDGTIYEQSIENPGMDFRKGQVTSPQYVSGGAGKFPPGFAPGGYGVFPGYVPYPDPFLLTGDFRQKKTPYKFTDPIEFAQKYGEFNRSEIQKNSNLAHDLAMQQLETELQGLQGYVPAAAAIKRRETNIDNIFNAQQRQQAVDQSLPGVRGQLQRQGQRAETYAGGNLPDSFSNAALELSIRSRAADEAAGKGFGAQSSVARKSSDLMSAEERFKIAQYGEQALGQNIDRSANLLLPPTEYSDAGQQVKVMPEVSASRLQSEQQSRLDSNTLLPTQTAFQGTVQQNQYETTREDARQNFNAQVGYNQALFNTQTKNQFALGEFGYNVSYAGQVAGAYQTDINTQFSIDQQKKYEEIFKQYLDQAKAAGNYTAIGQLIGGILGTNGGLSGIINSIKGLYNTVTGGGNSGKELNPGAGGENPPGTVAPEPVEDTTGGEGSSQPDLKGPDLDPMVPSDTPETQAKSAVDSHLRTVKSAIGLDIVNAPSAERTAAIRQSNAVLRSTGVSSTPRADRTPIGSNFAGQQQYANTQLLKDTNTKAGGQQASTIKQILDPLGVFSNKDSDTWDKIGVVADDLGFIYNLNQLRERGDKTGFVNAILQQYKQPILNQISKDPKNTNRAGGAAALSAFNLYQNWDKYSPAQKGLGLVTLGVHAYEFGSGHTLIDKPIPGTQISGYPNLTVGQALGLMQNGVNAYSLVHNWKDLNDFEKVVYGTQNVTNIAQMAQQFNLLGAGTTGAAVNTTAQALNGWNAASAQGVGALQSSSGAAVPQGYSVVSQQGNTVTIAPTSNLSTTLQDIGGVTAIAAGTYSVYKGWGTGGVKGAINGALGGSAIVSGLSMLGYTNPYTAAAIIAVSIAGNAIKTGKSEDQNARDAVRANIQRVGLSDKQHQVTLADGSKYDIGIDGHAGIHDVTNKDLLSSGQKGKISKLNAWDIDYTNDLDYAAGMGGIALSRLISGGSGKNIDQLGNQLGNATLGNVGYGKDFSEANYNKVMANARAMFAQSGIKSKADAYQLANQAFAEKRLNANDLVTTQQAINMAFDKDGYKTAQKLMAGRQRGIEIAHEDAKKPEIKLPKPGNEIDPGFNQRPNNIDPGFNTTAPVKPINAARNRSSTLTKEQIKELNKNRYLRNESGSRFAA